jgi:hypothetical protein
MLKLRKICELDGIQNVCLRHLPKKTTGTSDIYLIKCLRLSHFPKAWKETKVKTLPKAGKDPKFPQNLCSISLLSTTGKLFLKVILNIVQNHTEERVQLNVSQFCYRARVSTTLQSMSLTDHVTLNSNINMLTAAVFLDIHKAFDTTWHLELLYN